MQNGNSRKNFLSDFASSCILGDNILPQEDFQIAKTITGFPRDIFWKAFKLHFPHSTGETNYIRKGCQNQELQLLFASYQIFLMQV